MLEFPIYRKPTKKFNQLVERLAQLRMGSVWHDVDEHLLKFNSFNSSACFTITDSYFKNPKTDEVEFERFCKFRSALNLIIAVTSLEETKTEVSIIDCPDELIRENGIYANLTLTVSSTSLEQFKRITNHLELLNLS